MFENAPVRRRAISRWALVAALATIAAVTAATYSFWRPIADDLRAAIARRTTPPNDHHDHDHEPDHGHAHAAHDDPNHLDLSPQAQRNIGLQIGPVSLKPYQRSITIPGMVVERPGRTTAAVAAPLSGVITEIDAVQGEAVAPGQKLFDIRLTHEEIVQAQGEFLKALAALDVTDQEIARLDQVAAEGAIPRRTLLERKYEREKQLAVLRAQREALRLHGLSDEQVAAIERDRRLLEGLTVYAPEGEREAPSVGLPTWQIQELNITPGLHVEAGDTLALLADYRTLFIQGTAFEQDTGEIQTAITNDWPVTAVLDPGSAHSGQIDDLNLVYASGRIEPQSRTFHFFVRLPNEMLRDATDKDGRRFVDWRFKPGQRVQLRVPVEVWEDCLVLPVGAVAREGAESYVFQVNGNSFQRRPVHEKFRDPLHVVIANDGSIFPGDFVALSGAQQLQTAIKNKSGGAVDPHAGHTH